jgi:hypothetical protein
MNNLFNQSLMKVPFLAFLICTLLAMTHRPPQRWQADTYLLGMTIGKDTIDMSWGIYTPLLDDNPPIKLFFREDEAAMRKDPALPVELSVEVLNASARLYKNRSTLEAFNNSNFMDVLDKNRHADRIIIELKNVKPEVPGKKIMTLRFRKS